MRDYPGREAHLALVSRLTPEERDANIHELLKAQALREKYFSALPKVEVFTDNVARVAADRGYIVNWMGRRCHFRKGDPTYAAPNHLIQGGCADVMKLAMVRIKERLANRFHSRMLLQIYDELLVEVRDGEEEVLQIIKEEMETAYIPKSLALTCGIDFSRISWGDKEEWKG